MEMIVLSFLSGPRDGDRWAAEITGGAQEILIGRAGDAQLALPEDGFVGRRHAVLRHLDAAWWIEDLQSRNGTFLGEFASEARVAGRQPLAHRQIIRVGRTCLRFEVLPAAESAATESAVLSILPGRP